MLKNKWNYLINVLDTLGLAFVHAYVLVINGFPDSSEWLVAYIRMAAHSSCLHLEEGIHKFAEPVS